MNEIARYLSSQLWAMEQDALGALLSLVSSFDQTAIDSVARALADKPELLARLGARNGSLAMNPSRSAASSRADVRDGVAHIPISGTMMKQVPCMLDLLGVQATSTEAVRAQLDAALNDSGVKSIVLDVDSPGGTVDGTAALADDVAAVRGLKPIEAHVSDRAASAAYWVAAQTDRIVASPTAGLGSIGIYGVVPDSSEAAAKAGVKVNVISSHELKGAGVPGSPVTDAQIADFQRNVDTLAGLFVDAVAKGRGMSPAAARELATGQVWIGEEAKAKGLADEIRNGGKSHHNASTHHASGAHADMPDDEKKKCQRCPDCACGCVDCAKTEESTAALAASQENQMDPKEAAALAAENAKLKAQLEASEANAKALLAEQKKAVLAKHADKFMPAAAASFEKLAEHLSLAELEQHLASMPVVVRSAAPSHVSQQSVPQSTPVEIAAAKKLGTTPERIAAFDHVEARFQNGSMQLKDGRTLTREQFKSEFGV